jgi:Methyltransferase domain
MSHASYHRQRKQSSVAATPIGSIEHSQQETCAVLQGRLLRKKKRSRGWTVANIQRQEEGDADRQECNNLVPSVPVYISTALVADTHPISMYVGSIVRVRLLLQHKRPIEDGKTDATAAAAIVAAESTTKTISVVADDQQQQAYYICEAIELIRCAPDPRAVGMAADLIARHQLSPRVLMMMNEDDDDGNGNTLDNEERDSMLQERLKLLVSRQRRSSVVVAQLVRRLQGKSDERPQRPKRATRLQRRDYAILERMEGIGNLLVPIQQSEISCCVQEAETAISLALEQNKGDIDVDEGSFNLPFEGDRPSAHHKTTRKGYLKDKKQPQIQWMLQRVQELITNAPLIRSSSSDDEDAHPHCNSLHVLDVGGGRGDLAVQLARTGRYRVTMIDTNLSSLQGAQEYATTQGVSDRLTCVLGDFVEQSRTVLNPDIVVALHACGDLSDAALDFAVARRIPFVICPCCYTKRFLPNFVPIHCQTHAVRTSNEEQDSTILHSAPVTNSDVLNGKDDFSGVNSNGGVNPKYESPSHLISDRTLKELGRLAELSDRPEVHRRAAHIINSMRLQSIEGYSSLSLEEYDRSCSSRNMVLIGVP